MSQIKQEDMAFVYIQNKKSELVDINSTKPGSFVHPGGWTWNTKIVDLDSDGFQDIINSEGAIRSQKTGWNTFMYNQGNATFKEAQWQKQLTDPFSLFSFALIDFDFDGDLDIIGNSSSGPVQVYKNETSNHSISFKLRDFQGNHFGVGSKIYLKTAKGLQLREVKASGGYQSFDPLMVHFGLGESSSASELKVVWPDGERHTMPGTWEAGHQYEIRRLPKN
ncbi:MAG: CRTAC1 family protein [Oligoflexales bacterium]|nr:CRTAC1 family protein [Oligoflexales bacterium]